MVFAPVQVPAYLCGSNAVVMDYLLEVAVVMDHFSSSGSSNGSFVLLFVNIDVHLCRHFEYDL